MRYPEPKFFDFITRVTQGDKLIFKCQVRGSTPGSAFRSYLESIPNVLEHTKKLESFERVFVTVEFPDHFGTDFVWSGGSTVSSIDSLENYLLIQAELYHNHDIRFLLRGWLINLDRVDFEDYGEPLSDRVKTRLLLADRIDSILEEHSVEWAVARRKSIRDRKKIDREDRRELRWERLQNFFKPRQDDRKILTVESDPLNPHGDGTLRPGDAVFDSTMRGESVIASRTSDNKWIQK